MHAEITEEVIGPYPESGASSRGQYALARKIENMQDKERVEEILLEEISRLRRRLEAKRHSPSELKDALVILLYCATISIGAISEDILEFAYPIAIHLAEAAENVHEKRLAYTFCLQLVPRDSDLQLMLVNTLRKDLESNAVPRMALALEVLSARPTEDVIPAVRARLLELATHPSTRIRLLVIKVLQAFSSVELEFLHAKDIIECLTNRVKDAEPSVGLASSNLLAGLAKDDNADWSKLARDYIVFAKSRSLSNQQSALRIMETLLLISPQCETTLPSDIFPTSLDILKKAAVVDVFRLFSTFPVTTMAALLSANVAEHPVNSIRHLLSSRSLNDHYVFLTCLACLHPSLWAGTPLPPSSEDELERTVREPMKPVLGQWEVEKVMTFVDSQDASIRNLTIRVLVRVDKSIIESLFSKALESLSVPKLSSTQQAVTSHPETILRLLEIADGLSMDEDKGRDGQEYARVIAKIASFFQDKVSDIVLQHVLIQLRSGQSPFRSDFVCALAQDFLPHDEATKLMDHGRNLTLTLVFVASACEYASEISKDKLVVILNGWRSVVTDFSAAMQEPILLCMLRMLVFVDDTFDIEDLLDSVRGVKDGLTKSETKIAKQAAKRCSQFLAFAQVRDQLRRIADPGDSLTLPSFAALLDSAWENTVRTSPSVLPPTATSVPNASQPNNTSRSVNLSSPPSSHSKLRYAAYAPPIPAPKVSRTSRGSSFSSLSSHRSDAKDIGASATVADLSRTITAGDLAIASAYDDELDYSVSHRERARPSKKSSVVKDLVPLDSPFLSDDALLDTTNLLGEESTKDLEPSLLSEDPSTSVVEELWTAYEAGQTLRGWCDSSVEDIIRRLQKQGFRMDVIPTEVPPFLGELKVRLHTSFQPSDRNGAIIRLREGDEGSCLWLLRSLDTMLANEIKSLLDAET